MPRLVTKRSQSVVPFGVGSVVEFEDEALMPAGLDCWPEHQSPRVFDDRLAQRLGVRYFCLPPPKPERGVSQPAAPIPYVRFPEWHFCPRCRVLRRADLYAESRPRCDNNHASPRLRGKPTCGSRLEKKRLFMVPLRFLMVCPAGHIDDFPWALWAHTESGKDRNSNIGCLPDQLYFFATRIGGMSGLFVSCERCGKKRSLMGATDEHGLKGLQCSGRRPWLGKEGSEACSFGTQTTQGRGVVALQRGASNLYFPEMATSILIPPHSSRIRQLLSDPRVREALESSLEDGKIPSASFVTVAKLNRMDPDQLKEAYYASRQPDPTIGPRDEAGFRHAEYHALRQERRDKEDDLTCRPQFLESYTPIVRNHLQGISLIEQLTETRALTGFSRIKPDPTARQRLSLGSLPWLPAVRVRGEGIFLSLDADRLKEFERSNPDDRSRLIERGRAQERSPLPVDSRLLLLHTLAHLLIKRLSFEAGYGASSIRERVYSSPEGSEYPMAGLLLYTAAGDADGTLGGLVELGRAGSFERVLVGALEDARWCASDPICLESSGQGPDSLNLAACHACALLPETSCEFQNRLLDRKVVINFFST